MPADESAVEPANEHLLEEYKLAQGSAEHHDKLIWNTSGLIWGASLVLLGFVSQDLSSVGDEELVMPVGLLGLSLAGGVWWMTYVWNTVMRIKYRRCREIEAILGLRQHRAVEEAYPQRGMKVIYSGVSLLLVAIWLTVLARVQCGD